MSDYIAGPRTHAIAAAGLKQWHPLAAQGAAVVTAEVLSLVQRGETERKFVLEIEGRNERAWTKALFTTMALSIYEESRYAQCSDLEFAEFYFRQVFSSSCYVVGHSDYDGYYTNETSALWLTVRPPFDWLCSCSTVLITSEEDLGPKKQLLEPSAPLARLHSQWQTKSLAKAAKNL